MIADLHCHYPMHLLADQKPAPGGLKLCKRKMTWLDRRRAFLVGVAARWMDYEDCSKSWRVSFEGLRNAEVGLLLSAIYDPASELLVVPRRYRPRRSSFSTLTCLLDCVEADLEGRDASEYVLVQCAADLQLAADRNRMAFVHCVEGGFHLGPNPGAIDANIANLAERGVAYITLAHLFYRGVAANTNAIKFFSEAWYDRIFAKGGKQDLTCLGRTIVRAMYHHGILIDVSHMRADALAATFKLLDELDDEYGRDPEGYPVIASHTGVRLGKQAYMLDRPTIEQIARRKGVIGLILARHQLQDGRTDADTEDHTKAILKEHIEWIFHFTGSHEYTCIGSDLDGFIKPTMSQIESAADLGKLDAWLREMCPSGGDADAILSDNALRVVRQAFELRASE